MKPIEFKHQNIVFAKDQPEYQPLPALKIDSPEGEVISCWKMSFKERVKIVFTGRVWLSLMSFNGPLTPSFLAVNRKEVYSHPSDNKKLRLTLRRESKVWISSIKYGEEIGCLLHEVRCRSFFKSLSIFSAKNLIHCFRLAKRRNTML